MTTRDRIQMSLELASTLSLVTEARAALDRFTDLASIHALDGRSKLFLAGYHLRTAADILDGARSQVGPAAITGPSENISAPEASQSHTDEAHPLADGADQTQSQPATEQN
jgi:hypothetical protein